MSPDANLNADLAGRTPDIVGVLRRQWPIIVLCALAATVISYLYVSSTKVSYESKATILLVPLPGETAPGGGRERTLDVDTQATVARSTTLLESVGEKLGLTASQVKSHSRVEAAPTGNVLYVYFTDDKADIAAQGATEYADEFLTQRKATADDTAKREYNLVKAQIDGLAKSVDDLTVQINAILDKDSNSSSTELTVLQQQQSLAIRDKSNALAELAGIDTDQNPGQVVVDPRTAVSKTGLSKPLAVGGGMAVGLLIGLIVALLRDRRDDRYGSALGLEAVGVQEVGRLRYPGDLRPAGQRPDMMQRDYARLLVRLGFANGINNSGHRSILLVAVESTTLPHQTMRVVAQALAAQGPDNGLVTTVISPERAAPAENGAIPFTPPSERDGIDSNSSYWNQFAANLAVEMSDHDIVLVAAGAFDRSVAGLAVASKVDQTILLVSEATRVGELVAVIEDLESVDAREIGVVLLTKVPPHRKW
ncbi:MAG: lipopolysaccharide biosynthesis protein [Ilumatobacteraceae bacterium]|nr:lipopolysaccharide biosynthesis protein [Ilumatobacteraceae bacterium]